MKLIRRLISSDIPFARDDAHRLLPGMIACLTGFAALLLALAVCLTNSLVMQSKNVIGVLQIEVPRGKALDDGFMQTLQTQLKSTPGVEAVEIIKEQEMEALLKPWLGDTFELADLPVPVMLEVKTSVQGNKTAVDVAALRATLGKIDTAIRLDDRGPWVSHMAEAMEMLQGLAIVVSGLLIACVVGVVVLVARTNLRLHFKTVSLLHMFGATDDYILRQFQWNNAWLAARGALGGVVFAGMVFALAVVLSVRWESPVIPEIHVSIAHVVLFILLPVFTAWVSFVATRMTVKSMLGHMR